MADPARRNAPQNLLEVMIMAADEPGSGIDDSQVSGNVLTMLLAGEDTTANTLDHLSSLDDIEGCMHQTMRRVPRAAA